MSECRSTSSSRYDPQSLLNSQPVVISVIDPGSHKVQFQNDTGIKQLGNLIDATCYEKIAGESGPCNFCKMRETVETGNMTSSEVPLPNNRHLLVHWALTTTLDGATHVIETITDVTERKRTEQALRQAQKMEAIGRFAGGIAHDFNNMLTVINGYSQRLLNELSGHACRSQLQWILEAGNRAAALTNKLLAFTRHRPIEPHPLGVNGVIQGMEDLLRGLLGSSIKLQLRLNPNVGRVLADLTQLEQVVMNLVLNARDAMPRGGSITIETTEAVVTEAEARVSPGAVPGPYVRLSVQDVGCGMDADTLAHLYEPFYTTKEVGKGTGLGLATIYGIVKQVGGYIDVFSEVNKGTVFHVCLPRYETSPEHSREASPFYNGAGSQQPDVTLLER